MSSHLEELFAFQVRAMDLSPPVRQYIMPETKRRFTWDFAWPKERLLVDIQGAVWVDHKGHSSGTGITRDCEKLCLAVISGYRVMLVTGPQVEGGQAVEWVRQALSN
jgi:hypothetical protein